MTVNGIINASAVKVDTSIPTPDYVFDKDYDLSSLNDVKAYIDKNHHLPEIPSATQVAEEGIDLGEMNTKLLKKVEELTLYLIEKDRQFKNQNTINQLQERRIKRLETKLNTKRK